MTPKNVQFNGMKNQTTKHMLTAAFRTAYEHLAPGGLFLFDVWHAPAVLTVGPSDRVKEVMDERYEVKRTAHSEIDTNRSTVKVLYQMNCRDRRSGDPLDRAAGRRRPYRSRRDRRRRRCRHPRLGQPQHRRPPGCARKAGQS